MAASVAWRGLRGLRVTGSFLEKGGTELAPMSTTTDIRVAARYALSSDSVLLRLKIDSVLARGADLRWLSAFPDEAEVLYPPLTFLEPTGRTQRLRTHGFNFHVIEVKPQIA